MNRFRSKPAEQPDKRSPVPRELGNDETVARFIYSRRHMSSTAPKPGAFDPSPHNELSVAHSTDLPETEIWELGLKTIGAAPGRDKIHGRADVFVGALFDRKLRAVRDDSSFERHTSVVGWPNPDDPDERKQQRTEICLELSQDSRVQLVRPESPITRSTTTNVG